MFRPLWISIARAFALAATLATGGVTAGAAEQPVAPAMSEFLVPVNEAEVAAGADPATAARLAPPRPASARSLSPLATAMRRLLDQERRALADLTARLRANRDRRGAIAIERAIERVKVQTEVALLQLQLDAARARGRVETTRALEEAIDGLLNPRPPLAITPPARPAPSAGAR